MKTKLKIIPLALAAAFLFSTNSIAQDGSLDLTFGSGGIVTTAIGNTDDDARAIVVQPDGKILAAGYSNIGANNDFTLVRYNSDGSLDLSFDTDGKVTTAIGSAGDLATSMALQPDGKIVLAGSSYNGANTDFALVRYNSDGSLDLSFDTDGKVTTVLAGYQEYRAVSIQPDGKIVAAGSSSNDFALVRYNSDGSLDLSFDSDGIVTTSIGSGNEAATTMVLQADGKILVAGYANGGTNLDFTLIRYNTNGSLDLSFDTDGKVTTPIGSSSDIAYAIVLQPDGKIVLGGSSNNGIDDDFALVRYNSNGSLDLSFDTDGKVTTAIGSAAEEGEAIRLQADGKILLAGYFYNGTDYDFALARYNSDGSLDLSFDSDGMVTTAVGNIHDTANAMSLQSDGKILLAGHSDNGIGHDFALVRYNNTITALDYIEHDDLNIAIYPNPFSTTTTIQFESVLDNAELSIYNMYGQKVQTISNISDSKITCSRNELSSGSYLISLTQKNKVVATSKIVIVD